MVLIHAWNPRYVLKISCVRTHCQQVGWGWAGGVCFPKYLYHGFKCQQLLLTSVILVTWFFFNIKLCVELSDNTKIVESSVHIENSMREAAISTWTHQQVGRGWASGVCYPKYLYHGFKYQQLIIIFLINVVVQTSLHVFWLILRILKLTTM